MNTTESTVKSKAEKKEMNFKQDYKLHDNQQN